MTAPNARATGLQARSRVVATDEDLLRLLPSADGALAWVMRGEGLVGWGEAARFEPSGADRFEQADLWWRDYSAGIDCVDEVGLPGSGPVAFVSMAFADDPGSSVLVVPRVLVGRRDGVKWVTEIGEPDEVHLRRGGEVGGDECLEAGERHPVPLHRVGPPGLVPGHDRCRSRRVPALQVGQGQQQCRTHRSGLRRQLLGNRRGSAFQPRKQSGQGS